MDIWLVGAVVGLGIVHGVLPDHGWPIAALYALDKPQKWISGTIAALVLGVGHLISSVALVLAYFWFSSFAAFAEGPWMKPLAGGLLVLLGVYEYMYGGHAHEYEHDSHHEHDGHEHSDEQHGVEQSHGRDDHESHGHSGNHEHNGSHGDGHDHEHADGFLSGLRGRLTGDGHTHFDEQHAERGLGALGVTALALGFAHEEPVQILAICAGTDFCLELMLIYSIAVIGAILAPTLLLIAGYQSHRERIEQYTPYLPTLTAAVLVTVGLAFIFGVF